MTRREMLRRMDHDELLDWQAYFARKRELEEQG